MLKIESPQIVWQAGKAPYSARFKNYYFGVDDGRAEADYIYIQGNNLANRFQTLVKHTPPPTRANYRFCIAETGFGTGTNFLLSTRLWLEHSPPQSCLHFISFEKYPLTTEDLKKAHAGNNQEQEILNELINNYPFLLPGWHDIYLFNGRVRLSLWFGDVLLGLPEFNSKVDAWFLGGFTPSKNPSMWQPEIYSQMARLSHESTSFATFSSAGELRRGLEQAGFKVNKKTGFGKKREMCCGSFIHLRKFLPQKPWFFTATKVKINKKEVCIVGAGLAGAAIAYKMAEKGWQVSVIEAENKVATQASGNLAGAIHPLVTADWNIRSQFYLQGYTTTLCWLKAWIEQKEVIGDLNGLIQLAMDDKIQKRLQTCLKRVGLPKDFAYWCDASQASQIIGTTTQYQGMFFTKAGWVNPESVVKKCLSHKNITIFTGCKVNKIKQLKTKDWQIETNKKTFISPILVIATAGLDTKLNQQLGLNIRPVKGQVSHLTSELETSSLKTTVIHQGYSISNINIHGQKQTVTGATFEAPDLSITSSKQANLENIDMAKTALPKWLVEPSTAVGAKVGFRPTSADHLPIIGAVVDSSYATENYYSQSATHAVFRYPQQQYKAGLFVSNGHGARGLMSVFLAAEMIYSQVESGQQIVANSLANATHPERFRVRSWRNNKDFH